jgi:hypothetical protein
MEWMFIDIFFSAKIAKFSLNIKTQRISTVTVIYNKSLADAEVGEDGV